MDLCLFKPCYEPEGGAGCALCVHRVNVVLRIDWERRRKSRGWLRAGPLKDAFHRGPPGRTARSGDKPSMFPATLGDGNGHWPSEGQFSSAPHNLFEFRIRAAKKELLNARKRKTLGLENANRLQLEQMPPPVSAPGARFRSIQQSRAAVVVKCSRRKFARSLAIGGLQVSIAAPGVNRLGQLLNCPAIHHKPNYITNSVTVN